MSYQKVGGKVKFASFDDLTEFDTSIFDYIVCDEAHYFISDAIFNEGTLADFNRVMSNKKAIKIFMSATGTSFKAFCKKMNIKLNEYSIPIKFDYIKYIDYFYDDSVIDKTIKDCIESDEKCLFFITSAEKCFHYYNQYKNISLFNCSESNRTYRKYLTEKDNQIKLNHLINNEELNCQFLFTTTAMDAGVNINNADVHNILIDVVDIDVLKQCIGRKRLQSDEDYINLRVKIPSKKSLSSKKVESEKAIKIADDFTTHGAESYNQIYKQNQDEKKMIVRNESNQEEQKVNELKYFKHKHDSGIYTLMNKHKKHGYAVFLNKKLKQKSKFEIVSSIEDDDLTEKLTNHLNSLVGKKLSNEEKKELIELVNLTDDRNRLQKSFGMLNSYFKENVIQFEIVPQRNKSKRYWTIYQRDWKQK